MDLRAKLERDIELRKSKGFELWPLLERIFRTGYPIEGLSLYVTDGQGQAAPGSPKICTIMVTQKDDFIGKKVYEAYKGNVETYKKGWEHLLPSEKEIDEYLRSKSEPKVIDYDAEREKAERMKLAIKFGLDPDEY